MFNERKLVSIGLVVFNGEDYICQSLDSLLMQNYNNFELIISDNASTDKTEEICRKYIKKDGRIRYYRNRVNIGAPANFESVLRLAKGEYFMWAAHDDIWHPDFIFSCVSTLEKNQNLGVAFSNIINIDSFGHAIRTYPSFRKFTNKSHFVRIFNYVKEPEIMGKANIIYGVYRLEMCKKAWSICPLSDKWGADIAFVLAVISRFGICIDNRILFQKRLIRNIDRRESPSEIKIRYQCGYIFPISKAIEYIKENLKAVDGTGYSFFVLIILLCRLPQAFLNNFFRKLKSLLNYSFKFTLTK